MAIPLWCSHIRQTLIISSKIQIGSFAPEDRPPTHPVSFFDPPSRSPNPPLERLSEENGVLAADCEGEASAAVLGPLKKVADSTLDDLGTEEDFWVRPDSRELEIEDSSSVLLRNHYQNP